MIRYTLVCDEGHRFDGWFRDSETFEKQAERHLVSCPFCASEKVTRGVMAPHVARSRREDAPARLRQMIKELREQAVAGTEDVGDRFPDEARAIEEGDAERRPIRGRATFEEAKALLEEGIEILPLPDLPQDN
ncbi:DUF1178 family protein [Methylocystis sp. MJC1]|jgi:hypothetical protein|uniref:DUF1178 family protein n=1 Tax=Methylocystis sp. MJC1 TaxID=2654282 RepID=UPI0013ED0E17|nr:DUF1178 family protein [Methylocystis sp. MJC1]KAF2991354.1 hypothetical protein MJC1_01703 [Methylocystis sp. MJC1]MBU6526108.1 DUF1178 family protein [Methylocystis sp. MJC1]UZX12565.1 DUF1178 family protein [Methylocystis sp. MJC1]